VCTPFDLDRILRYIDVLRSYSRPHPLIPPPDLTLFFLISQPPYLWSIPSVLPPRAKDKKKIKLLQVYAISSDNIRVPASGWFTFFFIINPLRAVYRPNGLSVALRAKMSAFSRLFADSRVAIVHGREPMFRIIIAAGLTAMQRNKMCPY